MSVLHIKVPRLLGVYKCGAREFSPGVPRQRGALQAQFANCPGCLAVDAKERAERRTQALGRNSEGGMSIEQAPCLDAYARAQRYIISSIEFRLSCRIRIRPGSVGVMRGEMSERWILDEFELGVDPIGAVLVGETTSVDAPHLAASDLLGVSNAWTSGVSDGFADHSECERWPRAASLYHQGFEFGATLRREFFREPQTKGPTR